MKREKCTFDFSDYIYLFHPILYLNENQILYLFSTSSQVISAIFGLIITAYIFLRNSLDRKLEEDESLKEIIKLLKKEYYESMIIISSFSFSSIFLSLLVISIESNKPDSIIEVIINLAGILVVSSLMFLLKFTIQILNPNSFNNISEKLRKKYTNDKGSIENFLKNFNQINFILQRHTNKVLCDKEICEQLIKIPIKIIFEIAENDIDNKLKERILKLISLRNSLVNNIEPRISKKDVKFSKKILEDLKNAFNIKNED